MTINNNKKLIRPVWKVRASGQKLITIPASSDIEDGDYVRVEKVEL